MNAESRMAETLELLSTRKAMHDGTYFVGRRDEILQLEPCLRGRASVWLSGVRRVGKSSLARQIAARGPKYGTRAVWVGAGDISGDDVFDSLLERTVSAAQVTKDGSAREVFERLASGASAERPVLVVFDEFDRVATNLQTDEQAFLRRLADHSEHFGYLFITRADPSLLVEEVPDEMSRLLGICTAIRLPALRRGDVKELASRVAAAIECAEFATCAERIYQLVGGHSVAVMAIVNSLVVRVAADGWTESALDDVLDGRRAELLDMLHRLWRDLIPIARQAMLHEGPSLADDARRALLRDGYFSRNEGRIRPEWLSEVGHALGIAPATVVGDERTISPVERLHALVCSVNDALERGGHAPGFVMSSEVLRHYIMSRGFGSEQNLQDSVNHLAKVLYEGARIKKGGGKEWRLPPALLTVFKKHIGFQELVALRNFFAHDPEWDMDVDKPNSNFVNAGEVYERHCGTKHPTSARQWLQIRDGLLRDLIRTVEDVEEAARLLPPATPI